MTDAVYDPQGRRLDQVHLVGITGFGYHGVYPEEKAQGQDFSVDVTMHLDTTKAAALDRVDLSVDYGVIAQAVTDAISGPSVDLLETLASQIAARVLTFRDVMVVDVSVHKPHAPLSAEFKDVVVTIRRHPDDFLRAVDIPALTAGFIDPHQTLAPGALRNALIEQGRMAAPKKADAKPSASREGLQPAFSRTEQVSSETLIPPFADLADEDENSTGSTPRLNPPPVEVKPLSVETIRPGGAFPPDDYDEYEDPDSRIPPVPITQVPLSPDELSHKPKKSKRGPKPGAVPGALLPQQVTPPQVPTIKPLPVEELRKAFPEPKPSHDTADTKGRPARIVPPVPPSSVTPPPKSPAVKSPGSRDHDSVSRAMLDQNPREPVPVVLALGGNLGAVQNTIRQTIIELHSDAGMEIAAVAPLARTSAVGGPDQPDYLNTVVLGWTTYSPRDLLRMTQDIEDDHGRERNEPNGPRTLDIDLIGYGDLVAGDSDLQVPHPRAHERAFVLIPWSHVDPSGYLPGDDGGSISALADAAPDKDGVRYLALDWFDESSLKPSPTS